MAALLCLASLPLVACDPPEPVDAQQDQVSEEPELPPALPSTTLTLEHASDERISGTFTDNTTGLSLHFDTLTAGADRKVEVLGAQGRHILTMSTDGVHQRMAYLSDELVMQGPLERPPNMEFGYTDGSVTYEGDQTILNDKLPNTPELALLPWASRALGEAGFNGRDYPVALPFHSLALTTAKQLDIRVPPLDFDMEGEEGFRSDPSTCPSSQPYNRCGNSCFGMCGYDCDCWSWYCGTCKCVNDCHWHDWYCSCDSFWGFWCINVFWVSC